MIPEPDHQRPRSTSMDEKLLDEIRPYSSFCMDTVITTKEKLEIVLKRLVDDFESKLDGAEENIRLLNFISYLQWRKGDRKRALEYASKVGEYGEENHSLIYHNNEIIFRKEEGELSEYESLLEKAKQMHLDTEEYERQKTHAIAEIAYCYSRLGPDFHATAVEMYRNAIDRNENKNFQWEFGLALTLRRQSHIYTMRNSNAFNPENDTDEAIGILKNITHSDRVESELAARAWVELGVIYWNQHKLLNRAGAFKDSEQCFEKAMKLRPQAYFVLQRYGQYLRYFGELERSKAILEKSLKRNDTVFVRHHLALTLQKIALESPKTGNTGRGQRHAAVEKFSHQKNPRIGIKSPKKIPYLPGNQLLEEAVSHLKEALKMNNEFDTGRYELGLMCRYLKQRREAIRYFSTITCNRTGQTSEYTILVINAYEQQAICKMELADMETDADLKRKLKNDGKQLLWKSLEVASLVIKSIPKVKQECFSFPTLRGLLQNENSPPEEFAKLHELVHEYKESLDFYQKLVDLDSRDINAIIKVVESYLNLNEIDNAIGTLSLLQCTEQNDEIQCEFYLKVYLKGAEHSLLKPDLEEARMRFSQAYNVVTPKKECECASECECCDILVLCLTHSNQTEDCKLSEHLSYTLESCLDVKVLVNDKDCLPGRKIREYLEIAMQKANSIIIILTSSEKSDFGSYLIDIISGYHYKKSLAVSVGNVECNFEHSINIAGESCNDFSLDTSQPLVSEVIRKISELPR